MRWTAYERVAGLPAGKVNLTVDNEIEGPDEASDSHEEPGSRTLSFEVQVKGTPEQVWTAIATGAGISSWYVPHTVEERVGGAALASFGPAPEMQIPGRVAAWEPPQRIVFDGGENVGGLAFEWVVEPHGDDHCIVRLVNSGFGDGPEWDGQYDGLAEGWKLFLLNLRLHLEHFAGRSATSMLPTAMWGGPRDRAWSLLTAALGIPAKPAVGDRIESSGGAPLIRGTVVAADSWRIGLLLDAPAPGTAFIAAEGAGDAVAVSVWSYLYDDAGAAAAARDEPAWWELLNGHPASSSSPPA